MSDQASLKRSHTWLCLVLPVVLLIGLVALFLNTNPIQVAQGDLPPIENIEIQRIRLPQPGLIELDVINAEPDSVAISQVLVDDAYWGFTVDTGKTLSSLESATISIYYPWMKGEAHEIVLFTPTGITFDAEIDLAV